MITKHRHEMKEIRHTYITASRILFGKHKHQLNSSRGSLSKWYITITEMCLGETAIGISELMQHFTACSCCVWTLFTTSTSILMTYASF